MFSEKMVGQRFHIFLVVYLLQFLVVTAVTNSQDVAALKSLQSQWQKTPPNWGSSDPCGDRWEGIVCSNSRVVSIQLSSVGVKGQLPGDIGSFSELQSLDLSYNSGLTGPLTPLIGNLKKLTNLILVGCSFSGSIPDEIGSLQNLAYLSLNSNSFTGNIPTSIANLSSLYWLDLADNKLSGSIPVSNGSTRGLDVLFNTKHFHFGKNRLSGSIPTQLFSSNMTLIHVLFDGNQLTGSIPSTLGLVKTLEVLRLDGNSLGGSIPSSLNNLTSISEMYLSNNQLTGSLPDLTGMNRLNYVDLSNNSFDATDIPLWFSTLQSLSTLSMERTKVRGQLPQALFTLPQIQTLNLKNNLLNGTLDIGSNFSSQLQLIDLQSNSISVYAERGGYHNKLILINNPVCQNGGPIDRYCQLQAESSVPYSTKPNNCVPVLCQTDQKPSPNCLCSYPYMGTLYFRATLFSDLGNSTYYITLENSLVNFFQKKQLPVDSVSLSNPNKNADNYLQMSLNIFPSRKDRFTRSDVSQIGFMLSNQTFKPPKQYFGPFFFIGLAYDKFQDAGLSSGTKKKSKNLWVIIGAAGGGFVLVLLLSLAGVYICRRKRREKRETLRAGGYPSASRKSGTSSSDPNKSISSIPQLNGPRVISSGELRKGTNNFSEANDIGSGSYGKVYRGNLANGQLVAIKRSQPGYLHGDMDFKTEVELLSRVHHKNLVSLVGFCFEGGEELLVYEFAPNGTLRDSLSGKSGIRLDWRRRLHVSLGTARGLAYLHELADPPIIHRDIKTNNILLDNRLNAKVSDFGISKPMLDSGKDHVVTEVKGTMGYVDPEYYMTQQLTEKSDVYSFGVVMLELITAKVPLERGRYVVREFKATMDKEKDLYALHELLDPMLGTGTLKGFDRFVNLAMRCVEEFGTDRPMMSEVVKEIENIMQLAGMNPNAESALTSSTYDSSSKNSTHPYSHEITSGSHTPS